MTKYSAPWLPDDAAEYASSLRRDPNMQTKIHYGKTDVRVGLPVRLKTDGLILENNLSKRMLLDLEMEPVWKYLNSLYKSSYLPFPIWKHFLIAVQFGANGPQKGELRLYSEWKEDFDDTKKHIAAINRILRRYSNSRVTIGALYGALPVRLENWKEIPVEKVLDQILTWIWMQHSILPLLKSPNHPDAPYHYFVRSVYLCLQQLDENFNKWSLLARISNVTGLFPFCDSNKTRGTCKDLAQELA